MNEKLQVNLQYLEPINCSILAKVVKDAWKNLRTYFNQCKSKKQTATGLAEEDAPKKWKFFDSIAAFMITVPKFAEPE